LDPAILTATQSQIELLKYNLVRYEGYRIDDPICVFKGRVGPHYVIDGHTRARAKLDMGAEVISCKLYTSRHDELLLEFSRIAAEVGDGHEMSIAKVPIIDTLGRGSAAWKRRRKELLDRLGHPRRAGRQRRPRSMKRTDITPKLRLLVVEDDHEIRKALVRSIRDWGHTVLEASNQNAALEMLKTRQVDVLLTDIDLSLDPQGSPKGGYKVLREFRKRFPDRSALAFSQWNDVPRILEAYENGATDFIPKSSPFLPILEVKLALEMSGRRS